MKAFALGKQGPRQGAPSSFHNHGLLPLTTPCVAINHYNIFIHFHADVPELKVGLRYAHSVAILEGRPQAASSLPNMVRGAIHLANEKNPGPVRDSLLKKT